MAATHGAPSLHELETIYDLVATRRSAINGGVQGVGGQKKCRRIVEALGEAVKRHYQNFAKDAASISLARDARAGKLCVRVVVVNEDATTTSCLLGQARESGTTAIDIAHATKQLLERFATVWYGYNAAKLNTRLLQVLRDRVHVLTVDCASDELVAAELNRRRSAADLFATLLPNLQFVLRDKAHSSRRYRALRFGFFKYRNHTEAKRDRALSGQSSL